MSFLLHQRDQPAHKGRGDQREHEAGKQHPPGVKPFLMSRLLAGKTVLVIAHRMRTVEAADKIVVLSDGMVAEEGKPEELLADDASIFHRMAQLQSASAGWTL